jgi:dihydroorotase
MRIHIKNGRIVDPASGRDGAGDLYIADGKVVEEGKADRVIDARGMVVAPGFIDISARLREPGLEYKATLQSEMDAAVAGGV